MRRAWHSARPRSCVIMMIVMAGDSLNSRMKFVISVQVYSRSCPGFFGQQSSLLLAAVKFGRAMSRSRTQTYVTPTPAGTITKASSASTD